MEQHVAFSRRLPQAARGRSDGFDRRAVVPIGSGKLMSQRAQRGAPSGAAYVATMLAARETGSSAPLARKVNGTMVGVRFPPAREGSTTVSAVRKRGAVQEATSVTFSKVEPPE